MNKKVMSWLSGIFLVFFLMVSLPQAQSAEATVPVAATAVTGATEEWCPYVFTFKMGAMFLHRGDNKHGRLLWGSAGDPQTGRYASVGGGDLDLGWAPGMDTSIMLQRDRFGVELRYMGLNQWDESKSQTDYSSQWDDEASVGAKLKSRLHNVELNLHWWPFICSGNDRFNLLAGFRWLRLTDNLSGYEWQQGGRFYDYWEGTMISQNDLYGTQIGAEGLLFGKRDQGFSLDSVVKIGVFANNIRNKDKGWGYGDNPFDGSYGYGYSDSWNRTKTVMLSELGINLNYAFTKHIAMTVGYELLYISKIATPANDWGSTQHVLFQGSRVGLNFMF